MRRWGLLLGGLLLATGAGEASAGCAYGDQQLPGSIGPGQTDNSRSYTVDGKAMLSVTAATYPNGDPAQLTVTYNGHRFKRTGGTVACTVTAYGDEVFVSISNHNSNQVFYTWVCTSLN